MKFIITIQEMQQKCSKRTNYVIHTLSNKGVNLWNALDTKFKRINSYNVYKRLIEQHDIV